MSAVALTSALFTTPSFGADRPEVSAFETAMRSRNVEGAIDAYHALLLGKDAAINIDATADGQAGRLSMALGDPLTASALLERNAQGDQGNPALRGLASAYALLVLGDFDAAETDVRPVEPHRHGFGTNSGRTRASAKFGDNTATRGIGHHGYHIEHRSLGCVAFAVCNCRRAIKSGRDDQGA